MRRFGLRRAWAGSLAAVLPGLLLFASLLVAGPTASATTTPSSTLIVEVLITPKSVIVGKYASSATHDGFIPLGGPVPRGDYLNFEIINHGKLAAAFSVFGKSTPLLKPGGKGHFAVLALRRGVFTYRAAITGRKPVLGVLKVN
jgi:hypothetical protein